MSNDDRLIYLLSVAQQTLKDHTNRALAEKGGKVTLAQAGILFLLREKDGRYMSEMGQVIGVDNSAMTRLVDRLEKSGLVKRQIDPENRRAISVLLTEVGREEASGALKIIKSINEEIKRDIRPQKWLPSRKSLAVFCRSSRRRPQACRSCSPVRLGRRGRK